MIFLYTKVSFLSTKGVDYVEEPMKYQAFLPQFGSMGEWLDGSLGGWVGGGVGGVLGGMLVDGWVVWLGWVGG